MPLLRRQQEAHVCPRPSENMSGLNYGAVWECDECSQQWFLGDDQRDGKFWRRLEPEKRLPSTNWKEREISKRNIDDCLNALKVGLRFNGIDSQHCQYLYDWISRNRDALEAVHGCGQAILETALRIDALRDGPGWKLVDSPELDAELNCLEEDVSAYRAAQQGQE